MSYRTLATGLCAILCGGAILLALVQPWRVGLAAVVLAALILWAHLGDDPLEFVDRDEDELRDEFLPRPGRKGATDEE